MSINEKVIEQMLKWDVISGLDKIAYPIVHSENGSGIITQVSKISGSSICVQILDKGQRKYFELVEI